MYQFKDFKFGGGAGSTQLGPWDLFIVSSLTANENENSTFIQVIPGLIGGVLPTNWDQVFEVNTGQITYFNVKTEVNGQSELGPAEIEISSSPPDEAIPFKPWSLEGPVIFTFGVFSRGAIYRTIKNGDIVLAGLLSLSTNEATSDAIPLTNYYKIVNL